MAQELTLTKEEEAALDRIDAELKRSGTRAAAATTAEAVDVEGFCDIYKTIKGPLGILVKVLRKLGPIGNRAADAIEFLMRLADAACPA